MKIEQLKQRPAGEPMVWLTGMGLALGTVMVVYLLWVIFANGITVFWPKPVQLVQLKADSVFKIGQTNQIAGAISINREISGQDDGKREFQFFVGNKDSYGFMYKFIPQDDVEELLLPKNIMVAERLEYGNAIFFPVQLNLGTNKVVTSGEPSFVAEIHRVVEECNARREEYTELEKKDIGRINNAIRKIDIRQKAISASNPEVEIQANASLTQELERLTKEKADWVVEYEGLASQAEALRLEQKKDTLTYRLATGEIKTQAIGEIVDIYQPNQFGLWDKIGFFVGHFWGFLTENPREANTEGGIFPAIFGTFVMTVLMSVAVMPFGVLAAIYLREYAKDGAFVRGVRIAVNNLAGVPSIVFGAFGVGFFIYLAGGTIDRLFFPDYVASKVPFFGTGGILWASLTLALMTVPVVVVATEEALASVPRAVHEGALACGASKWQTIQRVVLPASAPGLLTGLILAMARGAGEVAPLMLVGVVKLAPELPIDTVPPFIHLDYKFMHLGFHIYDVGFQSPDSEAAKPMVFATTFLLILLVVVMNLAAILIRNHVKKKYSSSAF